MQQRKILFVIKRMKCVMAALSTWSVYEIQKEKALGVQYKRTDG